MAFLMHSLGAHFLLFVPGPAAAAMSHRSIIHLIIIAALGNNNNNNNTRAKTLKAKPSKACAMCFNAMKYSD